MATEAIKKENIIEMPDGSDMIAEAMREVPTLTLRLNMQSITLKQSISCPNTSKKSSTKNTAPTGIASSARILAPT